jgi:hypothetical protein
MATITFTDAGGAVTLSNQKFGPGNRFSNWTPDIVRVSDTKIGVGTGIRYEYLFRQDYVASFDIEYVPVAELEKVARFKAWALAGNTFNVNTQDKANRVHTCRLSPQGDITVKMQDRSMLEYTVSVDVVSAASPQVFLTCLYV